MCEKYVFARIKRKSILFSIKSLILLIALAAILVLLTAITVSATVYSPWTRVAVDTTSTTDIQCAKVGDANYTQEQDFTLGVLAINTHKSIYLPNEAAFIGIAVLDNEGHMVCDADVTLTITDPGDNETVLSTGNGLIKVSPQCCVYGVTNLPDFYMNYTVGGAGTYVMNLTVTAVTADGTGTKSITDVFTVQSSVDFDVARDGATRIYPPVPYVMNFTIKANKNYTGLIREYVPASFVITPQDGLIVTTVGDTDTKILTWTKNLVKGETYNIYYEFDAPDVSPYLFTLGALEIGNWKETRQWMIASDAPDTEILNPNAAGDYQQWETLVDTSHWGATSDDLDTTYIQTQVQGRIDVQSLTDPTFSDSDTVNSVTIYCRAYALGSPAAERIDFWDRLGTTDEDQGDNMPVTRDSWNEYNSGALTTAPDGGAWTKQKVTDLQAGIEARALGTGETLRVSKIWIVVDYTPPTWVSYSDSGHTTECNDFVSYADEHTVYMSGSGFTPSTAYRIIFWDGGGLRKTDDKNSEANGDLSSSHTFVSGTDVAGTWYASVYYPQSSEPVNHDDVTNLVADDTFEVKDSAIPEFSTVIAAIAVCMLCAVAYMVMRRKVGKR